MSFPRAYFDHAATSPPTEAALAVLREHWGMTGNASSVHGEGRRARAVIERARRTVASALGVDDDEIVFTSGGTESDNLALRGACWAAPRPAHLVTTAVEHEAVRKTARWLAERGDADVTFVAPGPDGRVRAADVLAAVRPGTALVSVMLVNSEVGVIQPVEEIGAACRERGVPFHVDAVQGLGRIPVRPRELRCDLLTLSAHKVGGPQGAGILFVRHGLPLQPAATGGEQEGGLRAGTESVAVIAAAARALSDAAEASATAGPRMAQLTDVLEQGLLALPGAALNGAGAPRAPGLTNVSVEGVEGELLVQALDLEGFALSAGSACSSGTVRASHVLEAMGLPPERARSALRISLGPGNDEAEVRRLLRALPAVVATAREGTAAR